MFGYYNEQQIRKAVIAFGSLFSNIIVQRRNETGDQVAAPFLVPIRHSPGGKDYIVDHEYAGVDKESEAYTYYKTTPRMGFEITGMSLDNTRQKAAGNSYSFRKPGTDDVFVYPEGVAVNIAFDLYILGETASDVFTIIEQIIPYFKPTLPIEIVGDPFPCNYTANVTMESLSIEDSYDGEISGRREVIFTIGFNMSFMLFAGQDMTPEGAGNNPACVYNVDGLRPGVHPVINKVRVDFYTKEINFMVGNTFVNEEGDEAVIVKALPDGVLFEEDSTGTETDIVPDPPAGLAPWP